jgi:hypothetical protein
MGRSRRFVFRCPDDVFESAPFTLDPPPLGSSEGLGEAARQFAEHVSGVHDCSGRYEVVPLDPPVRAAS